jgi:transcriptional regulator with XRE-family HTH domain
MSPRKKDEHNHSNEKRQSKNLPCPSFDIFLAEFPKRLRKLRSERGLTQEQLGELLGLKEGSFGNYERGKSAPPLKCLFLMTEIFHVDLDYLLYGKDSIRLERENAMDSMKESTERIRKFMEKLHNILRENASLIDEAADGAVPPDKAQE